MPTPPRNSRPLPKPARSALPPELPSDPATPVVTRRQLLAVAGGAGLVAFAAAACGGSSDRSASSSARRSTATSTPTPTTGSTATTGGSGAAAVPVQCVLTPEMTEGPYYLTGEPERRDVTEGKAGTPLRLQLTVADATRCTPIPGAVVEIWHADAQGAYSGFGAGASNRTFLRGSQVADANGVATFDTIYPGWYQGRATHIHIKTHQSKSASTVHTGQLFFDEAVNDAVYAGSAYAAHAGRRTLNSQDGIYRGGGDQSMVALTKNGDAYVGTMVIGIRDTV
jgi:protocatechuate 3,4-dioxygenase beta subunit